MSPSRLLTPQRPSEHSRASEKSIHRDDEKVLGQYIPLLYHYNMLQDADRVGAFEQAIALTVDPGMHVVELGGGTGILSSFAARRGARVTLVERNPELVRCASRLIERNGLADSITVIAADAMDFIPDDPADVVVCEMLHVGLLREKQAQVIDAFKRNHATAHGPKRPVFIPEASILMAQFVHQDFLFAGYHAPVPMFQAPTLAQPRTTALSQLVVYENITYDAIIPMRFSFRQSIPIERDGTINAVQFITQNILTIDEREQRAITWPNQCLVLPLDEPIDAKLGDNVPLSFDYDAGDCVEGLSSSLHVQM